ncbi:YqgE/AlgH family protein [Aquicoccus sp. SCR17]|nr:YqgE/AlgH family protein [Carideicomes alvinocaridis]
MTSPETDDPIDEEPEIDLTGHILIAMPGMGDPRFDHSVIFICAHSTDGAMGIVVNKPTDDLVLGDLLDQLEIEQTEDTPRMKVHFGGPVEHGRGFVLHSPDYASDISTMLVGAEFAMTATLDILEALSRGEGPGRAILALGYAGWGPGQLEAELAENGWLTCRADPDLIFAANNRDKWRQALKAMGVEALALSSSAGRA